MDRRKPSILKKREGKRMRERAKYDRAFKEQTVQKILSDV